jgi:ABC-type amino acid transport system permease subunit
VAARHRRVAYRRGIRNVPLLAHLLFWYFAFPELLPEPVKLALYDSNPEAICAVIALSLYAGVHMAEDIRSGIRASRGADGSGRALGLGRLAAMRLVLLPQALRIAVPPLLSQTLNLWKDTSVATVIGAAEMMYQAARVETATFRSVEAFAFATLAYLTVSLAITGLAAQLYHAPLSGAHLRPKHDRTHRHLLALLPRRPIPERAARRPGADRAAVRRWRCCWRCRWAWCWAWRA